ncbi:MAG: M24 family metallopeptidase, partial [Planctomycetes bacterium]|nr:M24 family metallopeptidase [Planctomycetota bacterium]
AEAAGRKPVDRIGLLTPRQVIPAALVVYLEGLVGRENVVDLQDLYYRIKYEKSEIEMALIRQSSRIAEAMMRAMLAVLEPGKRETEVAAWAYWVGRLLGAEETGFDVMVGSDSANRTLIGKALNRPIREGAFVHLGVSPKRDGLASCIRRSAVAVRDPGHRTESQRYWMDFVVDAYRLAYATYVDVARDAKPAYLVEKALVDRFASRADEVSRRAGRPVDLVRQKPYTGTHNAGYTECQEFHGAITLASREPLGHRIVTMLDVAVRGVGGRWDDIVIPDLDFVVVENTLAKSGPRVETLHALPEDPQPGVGLPGGVAR